MGRVCRPPQPFYTCLSSISLVSIPKSVGDVLAHPGWCKAVLDEISVLQKSRSWELVPSSFGKFVVGCRWIFAIKVGLGGTFDHLKACLVAKGYTQIFVLYYGDAFSLVAKMVFAHLFIVMSNLQNDLFRN